MLAEIRYAHLPFTASRPHFISLLGPSNEATCGGVLPPWPWDQKRWARGSRSIPPISIAGSGNNPLTMY
jgi:hypothetical protein